MARCAKSASSATATIMMKSQKEEKPNTRMSGLGNSAPTNVQRAGRSSTISTTSSHSNANSRQTATSEEDLKKAMKFAQMGLMSRQSCAFYEQFANNNANGSSIPKPLINLDEVDDDGSSLGSFSSKGEVEGDGAGLNNTTINNSSTPGSAFNNLLTLPSVERMNERSKTRYLPPQTKAINNIPDPTFNANSSRDAKMSPTKVKDFQDTTDTEITRPGRNRRSSVKNIQMNMKRQSLSDAEIRSARKGIMSKQSMLLYDQEQQQQILEDLELSDEENNEYAEAPLHISTLTTNISSGKEVNHPQQTKSSSTFQVDEDTSMATNQVDILTEGQHYLSISMLVYMYSHLRETCRMGHTRVTFEEIDVNSFQSSYGRRSPEEEALLEDEVQSRPGKVNSGRHRRWCKRTSSLSSLDAPNVVRYLDKTKSSGGIIRIVIDELGEEETDDDMDHNNEDDQRQEFICGNSANREYEKSMMKEFWGWIQGSKVAQLDAHTEEVIIKLRRQVARQRWKRAITLVTISRHLSHLSDAPSKKNVVCEDNETMSPNKAQRAHYVRRQVARFRWKRAITRVIIGVRLSNPGVQPQWGGIDKDKSAKTSSEGNIFVDMKRLMTEAVKEQPKYFRDGTIMANLIESGIEVVWFSDLSQNDAVYGICCQRQEKRVTVVFRGTVNAHNWVMNKKLSTTEVPNPVADEYPGRVSKLDLHTGFSLYMLHRRKDTQMNKTEEIFQKIDAIGREMCPDGKYELSITGHSLGGALATLLGFYVAASPKFENVKQVRLYTFAAPRVGTTAFRNAYQYMERLGKIRHARFSCAHDIVPLVPFCNLDGYSPSRWKFYKHVGMRVQLHGTSALAKRRLERALDVTYPLCHDFLSEMKRMTVNSLLVNLNTLKGWKRKHTLTEYQRSIHFASQYRLALGKSKFFNDQRRNRIKSLDEYYSFRANINISTDDISVMTDSVATTSRNLQKNRNLRSLMISFIVVVLMMFWSFLVMAIARSLSGGHASADAKGYAFVPMPDLLGRETQRLTPEDNSRATPTAVIPVADNGSDSRGKHQFDDRPQLETVESELKPLKEYYTSVEFAPKLDELYLVGAGVRKKSIIKVYSVAMYSSPTVLANAKSPKALGTVARAFDTLTPVTSFLLEMVYSVGAEKIASAIAESVRPRSDGSPSDINALESLIIAGVNDIGGQAVKGTVFRFDCSTDGVAVTVNEAMQGTASFKDLGSAFVDVFLDENAVSPTLVNSCVDAWSTKEAQIMASNLLESSQIEATGTLGDGQAVNETRPVAESHEPEVPDKIARLETIECSLKPMKEYHTSLEFAPKLDKLYLVGAGVRKKSIIKVYSIAMYSSPTVLMNAMTSKALGTAARTLDSLTPMTTFILKMVYSVGAEKIASAIAESVRPRYNGPPSDINALESLIIAGVNGIGGQAVQGTVFRFDCSTDGVGVTVGGSLQGMANFKGLGSAFVDVFMDENAVSPTLIDSCLNSWSREEAKSIAASLFEFSQAETMETFDDLPTTNDASFEVEFQFPPALETLEPQAELDIYLNSYSIDQIESQASDRAAKSLYRLELSISGEEAGNFKENNPLKN